MTIELHTKPKDEDEEIEQVELFSIDGVPYSVPNRVRPNLALQYLTRVQLDGLGPAEAWLGLKLLGPEAWTALLEFEDITSEEVDQVMDRARQIAFGLRATPANGSSGNGTGPAAGRRASAARKRTNKPKP